MNIFTYLKMRLCTGGRIHYGVDEAVAQFAAVVENQDEKNHV